MDNQKNQAPPPARLLRLKQVATLLNCSAPTVYRAMAKRGLPAHRMHGYWAFYEHEVMNWVQSQPSINLPSAS